MKSPKLQQLLTSLILLAFLGYGCHPKQEVLLTSPNQKLIVSAGQHEGQPFYNLIANGDTLIRNSHLGLIFQNLPKQTNNYTLEAVETSTTDTLWETVWGEDQFIKEQSNNVCLSFIQTQPPHLQMKIQFRLFDDGLGFRYQIPPQEGIDSLFLIDEITEFNLTNNNQSWWTPVDYDSYEKPYQTSQLSEVDSVQTPFTMKTDKGHYLSIHEAGLIDYASMTLKRSEDKTLSLECNLVPWPDGIKVKANKSMQSPWRSIQVGKKAVDLINSHLIVNLNEPNKLANTNWIKPMKYMGIWWGMHLGQQTWFTGPKHGATTQNTKELIDFASANQFEGVLVEGWNPDWKKFGEWTYTQTYPDFDLPQLSQYGKSKNVQIIGHHETSGHVENYESQLDSALQFYSKHNVKNIKTGYVGPIKNGQYHQGQWMVNHYQKVVEKAAEHEICIIAHEPVKPTGLRRTYPNFLSREGALGQEFNAPWSAVNNSPAHTTILPFTRLLAGPMDFTPGIFGLTYEKYGITNKRVNTTLAKQLALYVVIYSPVQMAADLVENYKNQPAFQFIKEVPVDWEKSIALEGDPGEFISIARKDRHSSDWFLGSISNETAREVSIPLSFLEAGKKYLAVSYQDGQNADWKTNPYSIKISEKEVTSEDKLTAWLAASGGLAIHFIAKGE